MNVAMDMKKKTYRTPGVLKIVTVHLERTLLESVVNSSTKVKTMGQEVREYKFNDSSFDPQDWYHQQDQ